MSFIQRELNKINAELRQTEVGEKYDHLHTAQQALSWALDPYMFKSPYDYVLKNTAEGSEDCPSESSPV